MISNDGVYKLGDFGLLLDLLKVSYITIELIIFTQKFLKLLFTVPKK